MLTSKERSVATSFFAGKTLKLSLGDLEAAALRERVPVEDALLIAINLFGISSSENRHRARVTVQLTREPSVSWTVIVPLTAHSSPFRLFEHELFLGSHLVAHVQKVEADEAVAGYFRDGGRAATLNPNSRSRCVGCAFCPNTLEAAADPRLSEDSDLDELFAAMAEQHPRGNLQELREVTVSTGCFHTERPALDHLSQLRSVLSQHGISARIGFLTSVVRTRAAFDELAAQVSPFVLRLTVECFTRRDLLLKESKASLSQAEMPGLLREARDAGLDTSYTYIIGLDSPEDVRAGVEELQPHITEFPNFQVYQAHNAIMEGLRAEGAGSLEFYLHARGLIERIVGPSGLRPVAWEGYRPLWYFTFGPESLVDDLPNVAVG
jgi:hypothetical protein